MIPPDVCERLAAASPNGRAEVLEGCGHLPSLERTEQLDRMLATFVEAL